jgi:flavin-dependent dehydrogenase
VATVIANSVTAEHGAMKFDVVVIGAGPAGAATARWLGLRGCRVALVERSAFDSSRIGESLSPAVQPLLKELGAWSQFEALAPLPSYGTRSAWGDNESQQHTHLMTPYLQGWHVDRLQFDQMLAECAVHAGAALLTSTRITSIAQNNGEYILDFVMQGETRRIEAAFLIDATGRSASIARQLGARALRFDKLVGVAVHLDDPSAADHCYTLVESTPDGWWYAAPIAPGKSVAMLMTDGDLVHEQRSRTMAGWQSALQCARATTARIAFCRSRSEPHAYSAMSHRLLRTADDRAHWLAVGDAALAVDPISGSGVVRALRTARDAANTAIQALSGDDRAIEQYEVNRNVECTTYLEERAAYYAMENRWSQAPFWARRIVREALKQAS